MGRRERGEHILASSDGIDNCALVSWKTTVSQVGDFGGGVGGVPNPINGIFRRHCRLCYPRRLAQEGDQGGQSWYLQMALLTRLAIKKPAQKTLQKTPENHLSRSDFFKYEHFTKKS
jgi:hypothetical protein